MLWHLLLLLMFLFTVFVFVFSIFNDETHITNSAYLRNSQEAATIFFISEKLHVEHGHHTVQPSY